MKYFELPTDLNYMCSFPVSKTVYNATVQTLPTSLKKIWTVRDSENNEIFKNLYMSSGINYAFMFAQFETGTSLKIIEVGGKTYIEASE